MVPSIEAESVRSQVRRKCRTFGLGGLPGLVFRPAIKRRLAELRVGSLLFPGDGVQRIAPSVVIVDGLKQRVVIVTIAMRRHPARQAQTDVALALRIAEAKSRDRENQIRQSENTRDLIDLVADNADGADTEPGGLRAQDHGLHGERSIDTGVEEAFQRTVANRLAAQLADPLQPPGVAEKNEEHRRQPDPRHAREQSADRSALRRITDAQDRCLLEIRFGRSTQGRGDEQIKQAVARNRIAVAAHRLSRENPADEIVLGNTVAGWSAVAKAPLDRVRIGRHQCQPRPAIGFWMFETFIANSTPGSKTLGIGIDPSDANSWLLRSPGILSRRALRGFLPLRRRLLDQPSTRRGTLATNSILKLEQGTCQTRRPAMSNGLFFSPFRRRRTA